jgi:hypothetical protein
VKPQEIETTTRVLPEGHIQLGRARWHEYGLRPKEFVTARIPGAMPQAKVNNGLRPNLGREMRNFTTYASGYHIPMFYIQMALTNLATTF